MVQHLPPAVAQQPSPGGRGTGRLPGSDPSPEPRTSTGSPFFKKNQDTIRDKTRIFADRRTALLLMSNLLLRFRSGPATFGRDVGHKPEVVARPHPDLLAAIDV